jgi:hypothetical protein
MKKLLFAAGLLLSGLSANAQWSSMTIVNHSACAYNVRMGANFKGTAACAYTTNALVITGVGTPGAFVSFPTYWDWAAFNNFVLPAGAAPVPDKPSTWSAMPGTAAPWGTSGCFEWKIAEVWPADAPPGIPGGGGGNTPHPCGPTYMAGDGGCGPIVPGPHAWSKDPVTGNVVLDLY